MQLEIIAQLQNISKYFMTNKIIFLISCFGLAAGFTFWDPAEDHPFLNTYFSNENITQAFAQLQINVSISELLYIRKQNLLIYIITDCVLSFYIYI